jgi:hypothetical protein
MEAEDFSSSSGIATAYTVRIVVVEERRRTSVTCYCHTHLLPFSSYLSFLPLDSQGLIQQKKKNKSHIFIQYVTRIYMLVF